MRYKPQGQVVVYKVFRHDEGAKHCVYTTWDAVQTEFDGAEFGDQIIVETAAMTPEEIKNLPDFEGW